MTEALLAQPSVSAPVQAGIDPRVLRTQRALRDALIGLMEERGLASISINDICSRAGVTRGTFYNHFRTTEEMVSRYESEILLSIMGFQDRMAHLSLRELAKAKRKRRPLPLVVDLFDYLRTEGDFLHAIVGPGGDPGFAPTIRDRVLSGMVTNVLHEQYRTSEDPFIAYYVAYFTAAVFGVIVRWIETGMQETSEEMAVIVMRLFTLKPGDSIKT